MRYGEYRESVDVDFLVADKDGYRAVRERATRAGGLDHLLRPGHGLGRGRDVRADQYGVRTFVVVDDVLVKFEIVLEGRVAFAEPGADDVVCGVRTLTPLDLATSKLLANADRCTDDSVFSRDVIDLAMMNLPRPVLGAAHDKAAGAYGDAVRRELVRAVTALRERRVRLEQCMAAVQMTTTPPALLWKRVRRLVEASSLS